MIAKHQAVFVFLDFILSLAMVIVTVLALSGYFNKTVEVNSCKLPPAASPIVIVEQSPVPSPSASASAALKVKSKVASPEGIEVK